MFFRKGKVMVVIFLFLAVLLASLPGAVGEDTVAPVVSITSPSDGSTVKGSVIEFAGTLSDEGGSGIKRVEYQTDEDDNWIHICDKPSNPEWMIGIGFEQPGEHTITVRAKDSDGNVGNATITLMVEFEEVEGSINVPSLIMGSFIVVVISVVLVASVLKKGDEEFQE